MALTGRPDRSSDSRVFTPAATSLHASLRRSYPTGLVSVTSRWTSGARRAPPPTLSQLTRRLSAYRISMQHFAGLYRALLRSSQRFRPCPCSLQFSFRRRGRTNSPVKSITSYQTREGSGMAPYRAAKCAAVSMSGVLLQTRIARRAFPTKCASKAALLHRLPRARQSYCGVRRTAGCGSVDTRRQAAAARKYIHANLFHPPTVAETVSAGVRSKRLAGAPPGPKKYAAAHCRAHG